MDRKILLLITILLFLAVFIVIFLMSLFLNKEPEEIITSPTPTITTNITTTPGQLRVTDILPDQRTSQTYLSFQKITLTFNEPVLPNTLIIETMPQTQIEIIPGIKSNEVFIIPSTTWQIGTTNISIIEATSVSGTKLANQINYSITTALPTLSEEELNDIHP